MVDVVLLVVLEKLSWSFNAEGFLLNSLFNDFSTVTFLLHSCCIMKNAVGILPLFNIDIS